jgi:RimJ/RimL family protein N-acetyltransferase
MFLQRPMSTTLIQTKSLKLVLQTRAGVLAQIERMPPHEKAQLSPQWLALLHDSPPADPWVHGFMLMDRQSDTIIGTCGFTGPPDKDGMVEIAYRVAPDHQGKGYATEAAHALTEYAFSDGRVCLVRAHTLPESNASTRVLTKCGFRRVGEVMDPEDGLVWRWDRHNPVQQDAVAPGME